MNTKRKKYYYNPKNTAQRLRPQKYVSEKKRFRWTAWKQNIAFRRMGSVHKRVILRNSVTNDPRRLFAW